MRVPPRQLRFAYVLHLTISASQSKIKSVEWRGDTPMKMYQNIMETIVEELKDSLDCCTCAQCRSDMIAFALNQLPTRYVATSAGGTISKADSLRIQHMTDIRTALIKASKIVKDSPRH